VRAFGGTAACRIIKPGVLRAASRFWTCVRCSRLSSTRTPDAVMRLPGHHGEPCLDGPRQRRGAHVESQFDGVATLFTFCPPGPDARTNRSSI
jgi:hypothetical protein